MAEKLTTEQKSQIYSAAVIEGLAVAGREAGEPDINAALGALMFSTAYLIAKIEDRNSRRMAEKSFVDALGKQIAHEVNDRIIRAHGVKPDA